MTSASRAMTREARRKARVRLTEEDLEYFDECRAEEHRLRTRALEDLRRLANLVQEYADHVSERLGKPISDFDFNWQTGIGLPRQKRKETQQ